MKQIIIRFRKENLKELTKEYIHKFFPTIKYLEISNMFFYDVIIQDGEPNSIKRLVDDVKTLLQSDVEVLA